MEKSKALKVAAGFLTVIGSAFVFVSDCIDKKERKDKYDIAVADLQERVSELEKIEADCEVENEG